jgi:hypothetical protein
MWGDSRCKYSPAGVSDEVKTRALVKQGVQANQKKQKKKKTNKGIG